MTHEGTINPFELVITASRELESLLESHWQAEGKGLHEKLTSIEHNIPSDIAKRIRYLATIRNKVVHESDYFLEDTHKFQQEFNAVKDALTSISGKKPNTVLKEPIATYTSNTMDEALDALHHRPKSELYFPKWTFLSVIFIAYMSTNIITALAIIPALFLSYAVIIIILRLVKIHDAPWYVWLVVWALIAGYFIVDQKQRLDHISQALNSQTTKDQHAQRTLFYNVENIL